LVLKAASSDAEEVIKASSYIALGLLTNLKETREVKRACQVEATSIKSVVNK
jgi:hypothetical protein